jgi:hypothetical protein
VRGVGKANVVLCINLATKSQELVDRGSVGRTEAERGLKNVVLRWKRPKQFYMVR